MTEETLRQVVAKVMTELQTPEVAKVKEELGIYIEMHDAIQAAKVAQQKVRMMPLELRELIITRIREYILEYKETLANMAVEETGMGKVGHKILKHELVAKKTPGTECISIDAWSGDQGLTLIERGPYGVIGAVTPSTNPSETVFCNAIGMIAAGNKIGRAHV